MCDAHYFRQYRNGDVGSVEVWDRQGQRCAVVGCGRRYDSHGLCTTHLRRLHKGGSVDYRPDQTGENNPAWRGSEIGYTAAHDRVRGRHGSARAHLCGGCGERSAQHWAYDHADPNELINPAGLPYSADPEHYEAMCVSCHKIIDMETQKKSGAGLTLPILSNKL